MPRDGSSPKNLPVSDLELYRIKRKILRYELYYALFHRQSETWLLKSQCKFLGKLTPWEAEELARFINTPKTFYRIATCQECSFRK